MLYKLQFRPSAFVQRALTGLEPKLAHDSNLLDPDISSTWIPEPVLEVTVPETLQAFKLSAGALSLPCHPNPVGLYFNFINQISTMFLVWISRYFPVVSNLQIMQVAQIFTCLSPVSRLQAHVYPYTLLKM